MLYIRGTYGIVEDYFAILIVVFAVPIGVFGVQITYCDY